MKPKALKTYAALFAIYLVVIMFVLAIVGVLNPGKFNGNTDIPEVVVSASSSPVSSADVEYIKEVISNEANASPTPYVAHISKPAPSPVIQAPETPVASVSQEVLTVTISVTGVDGLILSDSVDYIEGLTVADALIYALGKQGITYKAEGFGDIVYISAINDQAERDYGPMSGWHYKVNGVEPSVGCGKYTLSSGDIIEWIYEKDE